MDNFVLGMAALWEMVSLLLKGIGVVSGLFIVTCIIARLFLDRYFITELWNIIVKCTGYNTRPTLKVIKGGKGNESPNCIPDAASRIDMDA
jgi:hypothetical protein